MRSFQQLADEQDRARVEVGTVETLGAVEILRPFAQDLHPVGLVCASMRIFLAGVMIVSELARLRQCDRHPETRLRILGQDLPSVERDGALRDGESETHSSLQSAPIRIDSIERLENSRK